MADPIPQSAYDSAAAVFSRRFRFVEWKFVIAAKQTSTPFGDRDEPQRKAIVPIDRQKWIYVFRGLEKEDYTAVHEEIRIDKNGEMAATPQQDITMRKPIKQRRAPIPIGKTMCLPRRIKGRPQVYRFFASRVRIEKAQLEELEKNMTMFAPPVIFDPGENLSVIEQDGELLVPVIDPVTVALHLHAAFTSAADDIINYTSPYKGNKDQRQVQRRRKKHLLATILKSIIGDEKNSGANNLVNELKNAQFPLESFITHYESQVEWRINHRDRLGAFLIRWLASDAMKIAAAAFQAAGVNEWVRFLVPWCHAITRLPESLHGRKFLSALLDDKFHFIHEYVWPEKDLPVNKFEAQRKGAMTIIEGWKTFAEIRILMKAGDPMNDAYKTLQRLYKEKFELLNEKLTMKSVQKGAAIQREIRSVTLHGVGHVKETVEKVKELRRQKEKLLSGPLTRESIKESIKQRAALDRKIAATLMAEPAGHAHHSHFLTGLSTLGAVIETVNLFHAIHATQAAFNRDDKHAQELAVVGLTKSIFEEGQAISALLMKKPDFVVGCLGLVAGILETYISHAEMKHAFKDGDQDAANGSFLTGAGATTGAAGSLLMMMSVPGAQIVVVIGLLVVAAGFIYKLITGRSPLERFFAHCTWGKEYGQAGGGDWSPTRFEQWKGDSEFDYQFEALLNIICKIDISNKGQGLRNCTVKMGWLPPDSTLTVKYDEKWDDKTDNLETEILVTDGGLKSTSSSIAASADGNNAVKISPSISSLTHRDPYVIKREVIDGELFETSEANSALKKIQVSAKLLVTLDGLNPIAIPHAKYEGGWEKKKLHG